MKRLLIAVRSSVFPPEHGGAKNILQIARSLAQEGVECLILGKKQPEEGSPMRFSGQHPNGLRDRGDSFTEDGVAFRFYPGNTDALAGHLAEHIETFQPDAVLLCDDSLDDGRKLFQVGADSGRLLFLAQTIHCLPFGPYTMLKSPELRASIERSKWIVAPSQYVADYIEKHLGKKASVYYPNVFGAAPFPELGGFDNRFVTMVNPCPWKGSSIFLALAKSRPDLQFAAVPTWGANERILAALRKLSNVTILPENADVDAIYRQTRVLLTPSICQEAFGLVSPEAMLRGIPVIASDIAGLRESTLGIAPLIPVTPLSFEKIPEGEHPGDFLWEVPDNDIAPWNAALNEILANRASYETRSQAGRHAAESFVESLSRRSFLDVLSSGEGFLA